MPDSRSRRLLITGASGFVGANLARQLVSRGFDVHAIVRSTARAWRIADLADRMCLHDADLCDADAVRRIVSEVRPQAVLHFAAHAALPQETDEMAIVLHTLQPLVNLVAASQGCELFINAGSSSEYGYQTAPMAETSLPDPTRVHDIAKLTQTLYGTYAARFRNVPLVTLRLFSVYGPWEQGRRLIPRLMRAALRGQPIDLSSPDVSRDFIFVDDVVRAVVLCLERNDPTPGAVYNLGTGVEHTIRDVVEAVEEVHGAALPVRWGNVPRQRWDSPHWVADVTRQTEELGFVPRIDLRQGIALTYRWFADQADRYAEYE